MEPLLDPAVEAQVVGRVHRIGQTRATVVHRLVMDASVEENVCQINSERAATMDLSAAAANQAPKAEQQSLSIRYGCASIGPCVASCYMPSCPTFGDAVRQQSIYKHYFALLIPVAEDRRYADTALYMCHCQY